MIDFKSAFKAIGDTITEHSQTVMGVGAILGVVGVVILTYKKSPEIHEIVEEQRCKKEALDKNEHLTEEEYVKASKDITKETVRKLAPKVAPIAACTALTVGLTIGSVTVSEHKIADLTRLVGLQEIYNREIIEKTKEVVGEDKAREIRDKVDEDRTKEALNDQQLLDTVVQAKGGHDLFYDPYTGMMFYSDLNTVREAFNDVNDEIIARYSWYPYAEVFKNLDLTPPKLAELVGAGGMYCKISKFEFRPNHAVVTANGKSAIVISLWDDPMPEDK